MMYSHFDQKWSILHHGPMWRVTRSHQSCENQKALVNIPANSERTLQRDISASGITITSEIQVGLMIQLTIG